MNQQTTTQPLLRVRLRHIMRGDFRKSEETLTNEVMKEVRELKLGKSDAICMLSSNGKIMRFVFGFLEDDMIDAKGNTVQDRRTKILPSRQYRITQHGTFNPLMLANYAEAMGIELAEIKRFESYVKQEVRDAANA